ncbi:hypothetical protein FKM82_015314 [Ascaphus truei]
MNTQYTVCLSIEKYNSKRAGEQPQAGGETCLCSQHNTGNFFNVQVSSKIEIESRALLTSSQCNSPLKVTAKNRGKTTFQVLMKGPYGT